MSAPLDDLAALIDATLRVNSTEDLETMYRHILRGAREVLRSEAASLLLREDTGALRWFSAIGDACPVLQSQGLEPGEGIAGWVAQTGESVLVPDVAQDPRFCARIDAFSGFKTRALICVPLLTHGHVQGVLQLLNPPPDAPYTPYDLQKAQAFASLSAVALENHHLLGIAEEVGNVREIARLQRDMTYVVAHEVLNPLTAIRGFAEALADDTLEPGRTRDFAERIRVEAGRVAALIDDFLAMSRMESGQIPLHQETLEVRGAFERCFARHTHSLRRIATVVDCPRDLSAQGDPARFDMVLDHLVRNAISASHAGCRIELRGERTGGTCRISVVDTGTGIAPVHHRRIFHPFYRVPGDRPPGSGLGLTVARTLVEGMQGRMGVHSVPGEGATFWFTLPAE